MLLSRKIIHVTKKPGLHSRLFILFSLINGALCVDSSYPSLRSRKAADLGHNHNNHLEGQEFEEQRQTLELLRQEMESGFTDLASKLSAIEYERCTMPSSLQRRRTQATTTLTDTFYKRECEVSRTISPTTMMNLALEVVRDPPVSVQLFNRCFASYK